MGALFVDSGKKQASIPNEDFEYLKVIGEAIGAAVGKAELSDQLTECYRKKEAIVKPTVDAFRNRITVIGTISQHISRLAEEIGLANEARQLYEVYRDLIFGR